jgi:arylsulfatase A-like enzyme
MLVYAPGIVEHGTIDTLASQIDVVPTLFSMLGWSYDSEFFGKDLFKVTPDEGRALIGTYQSIGLLDTANHLTVLEPGKRSESFEYDPRAGIQMAGRDVRSALTDTIAFYQSAADLYAARTRHRTS